MGAISNKLLRIEAASQAYAHEGAVKPVLADVSVDLDLGDSLSVIGPSGCGKTTLLLMIAGLIPPDQGRILIKGRPARAGRAATGLVLQDYGLFPWKTVRQNILLGALVRKAKIAPRDLVQLEEELGIDGLGGHYPQQLSGGQRQRVALGRALLLSPDLLLLDEPFAALDALTRERMQTALLALFDRRRFSFIIVTHHIEEAAVLGRRIMVLNGRPAKATALLDNPTFGRPDQRESPDFFALCVELRRLLGEES
jgi:NitT/TauT family transport system ATP-binding protein